MSNHFKLSEMLVTSTGLYNQPTNSTVASNIDKTMWRMDEVRDALGKPVRITSGYRSHAVNSRIGGSTTSDHLKGLAVDFVCAKMDPIDICQVILDADIEFDQLIAEYHNGSRWVHIGFGDKMRQQVLTYRNKHYHPGVVREDSTEA